ncbi:hypothetical protein A0H81_13918 [Grifola frondosa]|uniref:Uncharacterized protein n=1 Tax=Grifola frondosa TaxID=5627 RepID=A0A1C7LPY6_GRIFR|nr:hypothetical protein A0H81_13918 [Grifola frondosa]
MMARSKVDNGVSIFVSRSHNPAAKIHAITPTPLHPPKDSRLRSLPQMLSQDDPPLSYDKCAPRVMLVLITFLMLFGRLKFYYSKLVAVQNAMIEQLFNEAIVRVSDLGSRELLVNAHRIVDEAKKGKGLQKLSSKIHGVVDRIIAANNYVHDAVKTITYKSFPSLWLPSRDPQRNQVADVVNDARNLRASVTTPRP